MGFLTPPHYDRVCDYAASQNLAEGVGFEPTVPHGTTVFKTVAISLSATLPMSYIFFYLGVNRDLGRGIAPLE